MYKGEVEVDFVSDPFKKESVMNTYEIKLTNGDVEVVEGDKYFCDALLVSIVRGEGENGEMVATFHNWENIRIRPVAEVKSIVRKGRK